MSTGKRIQALYGDKPGQTRQALRRLEAALQRFGTGLEQVLRLDVFLDDIYFEDEFIRISKELFGDDPPTMNIVGAELEGSAEVEVSAIAGSGS